MDWCVFFRKWCEAGTRAGFSKGGGCVVWGMNKIVGFHNCGEEMGLDE